MESICLKSKQFDSTKGFEIKIGLPASLRAGVNSSPASGLQLRGAAVPSGLSWAGKRSTINSQCDVGHLFSSTIMLAHQQSWGADLIAKMMAAESDNERLCLFEDLAEVVCAALAERAVQSGKGCANELVEILVSVGGEQMRSAFQETYNRFTQVLDLSFGLVNDMEGNEFGCGSHRFNFRLFSSLDFDVSESKVTSDYLAAIQGCLIEALPTLGFVSHLDFMDYTMSWMAEESDMGIPDDVTSGEIRNLITFLEAGDTPIECDEAITIEQEYPEVFAQLVSLTGSPQAAKDSLCELGNVNANLGMETHDGLLSCLKYHFHNALTSEVNQSRSEIEAGNGVLAALSYLNKEKDNTYLGQFLHAARFLIAQELAVAKKAKSFFSYADESDAPIDFKLPIETLAIADRDIVDSAYQDHYEMSMNGDVSTVSACVVMGGDTVMALEGWQRAIAIMAAINTAANQERGGLNASCS